MVPAPSRGSHQMANNCPYLDQVPPGCARRHSLDRNEKGLASWKDGKLTGYPDVGQAVSSLLQEKERFGLGSGTRAGSAPSEPARRSATELGVRLVRNCLVRGPQRNQWASAQTGLWRWRLVLQFNSSGRIVQLSPRPHRRRQSALLKATGRSGPLASSVTGVVDGLSSLWVGKF